MASLHNFNKKLLCSFNPNLRLDLTGTEEHTFLRLALDEGHDTLMMIEWQVQMHADLRRKLLQELEAEVKRIVCVSLLCLPIAR